jgi:hypothetical protein
MTTSLSRRLGMGVLTLLIWDPAGQCAGQETGKLTGSDAVQRTADRKAGTRVLPAEARALLLTARDPDEAYAGLKEALDAVRSDPVLSEAGRERLQGRLEWALSAVAESGRVTKQVGFELLALQAEYRAGLDRVRLRLEPWKARQSSLLGGEQAQPSVR